jgi:very-short-patch-repair endonuclease
LGEGWVGELGIRNHATNWKVLVVDIGHPEWKIAVEVDGQSHKTAKQKNRDSLKEKYLVGLGWKLIRFWNSEVDRDISGCVERVLALHRS